MNERSFPSRFVRSLLRLVVERGHDHRPLLRAAELDFDPMEPGSPGYRDRGTAREYSRLYQQVLSLLQDRLYGLTHGAASPGAFRMMCYCIIHSDGLGQAIDRACEFYRIFFEADARMTRDAAGGLVRVGYGQRRPGQQRGEVATADLYGLHVWHRLFCWLIGRPIELAAVQFRDRQPADDHRAERYAELFGCPVHYGGERNAMVFADHYLDHALVHTEQSLKAFLRAAPYPLMVLPGVEEGGSVSERVRALLGHDFSQGLPGFDAVAAAMGVSPATLRRRLQREGTSFQTLKDECRCEAATLYLANPELSIHAVATLMGFTDASAFHRSFRKWTGMTPGAWRRQAPRHGDPAGQSD